MKPARFAYDAPPTLAAALALLAEHRDDAKVVAGGQSLAPMLNMRLVQPARLIDINGLPELASVTRDGDRLVVGALMRHADLARDPIVAAQCPMLACAAGTIGHYAIRQRGTLGGSLAHADPAAQLPLVALALDAEIEVASAAGRRRIPARDFFVSILATALEPDELIVAVRFPVRGPREGWSFRLFSRRAGDFALAAVAASLALSADGALAALRLAAGGLGPVPLRVDQLSGLATGVPMSRERAAAAARAVGAAAEIEENERVPADYRRELLAALAQDALDEALERAR